MLSSLKIIIPIRLKYLKRENAYGNCEYQWKLIKASPIKIQKLATQMCFRLVQCLGKAIYILGVRDDGNDAGLTKEELIETQETIYKAAKIIDAKIVTIKTYLRNVTTIRLVFLNYDIFKLY